MLVSDSNLAIETVGENPTLTSLHPGVELLPITRTT